MRRRSVGNTVAQVNSLRAAAPIGCSPVTSRRSCVVFASRVFCGVEGVTSSPESLRASVRIFQQKRRSFKRIRCVWSGRKLSFKSGEFFFCESLHTITALRINNVEYYYSVFCFADLIGFNVGKLNTLRSNRYDLILDE